MGLFRISGDYLGITKTRRVRLVARGRRRLTRTVAVAPLESGGSFLCDTA